MKKLLLLIITFVLFNRNFCQISTTRITKPEKDVMYTDPQNYDSLENFLSNRPGKYIGQDLYLNKKGYYTFTRDPLGNRADKDVDKYFQKYFRVLEIIKHPRWNDDEYGIYSHDVFIKLEEKESKKITYYSYNSNSKYSFPFIVVGYFNKLKEIFMGKQVVITGKSWIDASYNMNDIYTGKPVRDFDYGSIWSVSDVSIEEKYSNVALILYNKYGEKFALGVDYLHFPWIIRVEQ